MTDAAILARATSGALLVVAAGRTTKHQLTGAAEALVTVGAKLAGFVMSMVPTRGPDSYYAAYGYGYGYGYGYRETPAKPTRKEAKRRRNTPAATLPDVPDIADGTALDTPGFDGREDNGPSLDELGFDTRREARQADRES